jgi:hypothetical protein
MFSFQNSTVQPGGSPKELAGRPNGPNDGEIDNATDDSSDSSGHVTHIVEKANVSRSRSEVSADDVSQWTRPSYLKKLKQLEEAQRKQQQERLDSLSEADESRDDATDACTTYSTIDGDEDTYTSYSYVSRDESRLSNYTEDGYTRGSLSGARYMKMKALEKLDESDEDDDHDDMTMFSTDTDYKTLATLEERDFARFVQTQQMGATSDKDTASVAAEKDAANHKSNAGASTGFCANFLDVCGFLAEEMTCDKKVESSTKKKGSNTCFAFTDHEDVEYESGGEEEEDDDDDDEEETLMDVYQDASADSANYTRAETPHSEDEHSNPTEKHSNEAPSNMEPATGNCKAEPDTPSTHKRRWNKIGRSLRHSAKAMIPRKNRHSEIKVDSQETDDEPSLHKAVTKNPKPRSLRQPTTATVPKKKQDDTDIARPTNEHSSMKQESKEKPQNRAFKMLKGLTKVQTGSPKLVHAAVMTTVIEKTANKVRAFGSLGSTKSRDTIEPNHDSPGDSKDRLPAIPLTKDSSFGGRSITKERFQKVITEEEAKVKTIKKVKVGTDENGNDTFAFLVFMSDAEDVVDEEKPATPLVLEKMDDDDGDDKQMELNTESCDAMQEMVKTAQDDSLIQLTEVDETPKSDAMSPLSKFNPKLPNKNTKKQEQQSVNMLKALSFKSSGHVSTSNLVQERSLGITPTPQETGIHNVIPAHELVLMEMGDEDEIEIELEEDSDDDEAEVETRGDHASLGHMPRYPVSSDCAVAAFSIVASKSVDCDEGTVSDAVRLERQEQEEEKEPEDLQDRSLRTRRTWWKRKQGK